MRAAAIVWVASATIAASSAGCGGDAFTSEPRDGGGTDTGAPPDSGPPGDSGGAGDGGGAGDAGPGFCATHATGHTFCEDFSGGVPGPRFGSAVTGGGMLKADTTDFRSGPPSMFATIPALANRGDGATALVTKDFSAVTGTQLSLSLDSKVEATCSTGNNGDFQTVAAFFFPESNYELAVGVTQDGLALIEVTVAGDGGVADFRLHQPQTQVRPSGWQTWVVSVSAALAKSATITIGGMPVFTGENLKIAPVTPLQHPTLVIGPAAKNQNGRSAGCGVHADDILFDLRSTMLP